MLDVLVPKKANAGSILHRTLAGPVKIASPPHRRSRSNWGARTDVFLVSYLLRVTGCEPTACCCFHVTRRLLS